MASEKVKICALKRTVSKLLLFLFMLGSFSSPVTELLHQISHFGDYIFQNQGLHFQDHTGESHSHDWINTDSSDSNENTCITNESPVKVHQLCADSKLISSQSHLEIHRAESKLKECIGRYKSVPHQPPINFWMSPR